MSLRPDFQPRPPDDQPGLGRRDALEYEVEMAEWDELVCEFGMGSWEAAQARDWLTCISGPPEGSQARRTDERGQE